MSNFVERDFYHTPPTPDASPEEWERWMTREKRSRAAHKAQHTKSLEHDPEGWETMFHTSGPPVKVNGVFRQSDAFVGFTGSKESGDLSIDVAVQDDQEHIMSLVNMEKFRNRRGGKTRSKNARRRRNRKARQQAQQQD